METSKGCLEVEAKYVVSPADLLEKMGPWLDLDKIWAGRTVETTGSQWKICYAVQP